MRRALIATAAILAAVVFFLLVTMPPAPLTASGEPDPQVGRRFVSGAYHVHSTRSDGGASRDDVAAAAARAGLQFVVFTEHGDGTAAPEPPAYLHGVLCVDGVEISTNSGHYVALDMPAAPYRLGGEAYTVVEDVRRLGGFGIAAHPHSTKDTLRWTDWSLPIDGLEWLNADSEWRDEPMRALARLPFDYFLRPQGALASMLDRPSDVLSRWDEAATLRPIVALAAHDAHGGVATRLEEAQRFGSLGIPSYEASFRTFRISALLAQPLQGDAARDARELLQSLRSGRVVSSIGAVAAPAWLDFRARQAGREATMGERLEPGVPTVFTVRSPRVPGATNVLVCNGTDVDAAETDLEAEFAGQGACRAETRVPGAPGSPPVPWIVGSAIYLHDTTDPPASPVSIAETIRTIDPAALVVEKDPSSRGAVASAGGSTVLTFELGSGSRASQYVAFASPVRGSVDRFDRIVLTARASGPMRVSVQLRFDDLSGARWGASVYVPTEPTRLTITIDRLRPFQAGESEPPWNRTTGVLLVVDLTNAAPGFAGTLEVLDLAFALSR